MIGTVLGVFAGGLAGAAVGVWWASRPPPRPPAVSWVELPSGRACHYRDGIVGYVAPRAEGGAYWWIARRGRTLVEGPCGTVGEAQREADAAVREFS